MFNYAMTKLLEPASYHYWNFWYKKSLLLFTTVFNLTVNILLENGIYHIL